jgi:aldose 1-epimerase
MTEAIDTTETTHAPSGAQVVLRHGTHEAVVTEVGATLRAYTAGGLEVIQPYAVDEIAPASHGAVLAPWPNRLRDGAYTFDGTDHQVPVNEVGRMTALHGLVCWVRFEVSARTTTDAEDAVELTHRIVRTSGYPFDVVVTVRYALSDAGLTVTTTATTDGARRAPYGVGFHPWLSTRGAAVDDCTLRLDADTRVTTDDRLLPVGTEPVAGPYDHRVASTLAGTALDDAFVGVLRDADGLSWAELGTPDGRTTRLWMDETFGSWQVCTGDFINPPSIRRSAVAVEPQTCYADAFRTGELLVVLEPGASHTSRWGLTLA